MTDQHPLTDDIIDTLASPQYDDFGGDIGGVNTGFTYDDLRAAADWQLEQVVEWLEDNMRKYVYQDYYGADEQQEVFNTLEYLKKAMRPTTTQENSND